MKCDFCPNDASIEIVVFVNGEAKKIRMCPDCYKEKLQEMMENMPKEWGGAMLGDQLKAMMEKMEQSGALIQGLEFRVNRDPARSKEEFTIEQVSKENEETRPKSARDRAFDEQLKALRRQRAKLVQELDIALAQEEYEKCAGLRDDIAKIGDDLVKLNEERKNPYGV